MRFDLPWADSFATALSTSLPYTGKRTSRSYPSLALLQFNWPILSGCGNTRLARGHREISFSFNLCRISRLPRSVGL